MWFPVQRHNYLVQSSIRDDCVFDPADLDLEHGCEEPDLCFSRSQVRDSAYALLEARSCMTNDFLFANDKYKVQADFLGDIQSKSDAHGMASIT